MNKALFHIRPVVLHFSNALCVEPLGTGSLYQSQPSRLPAQPLMVSAIGKCVVAESAMSAEVIVLPLSGNN